ncbi:MAG: response regulator [Planctomycetales bacterium]|jgi:two-component system sensor histidine kinase/response regulator
MKILLAEDSRTSQQLGVLILEDEGHPVEVANHGLEAVEKSAMESFDLILMDVVMPELDRLQATTQTRRREQSS